MIKNYCYDYFHWTENKDALTEIYGIKIANLFLLSPNIYYKFLGIH